MKSVLIVGKGRSCRPVKAGDDRLICALNGAIRACESADILFINDHQAFSEVSVLDLEKFGTIVMPTALHVTTNGRVTSNWICYRHLLAGKRIELYRLPSAPDREEWDPENPHYFGQVVSVADSAVAWLLHEGYRKFETIGIDPEGGYHDMFSGGPQVSKPAEHFKRNWKAIRRRVSAVDGATIERIS